MGNTIEFDTKSYQVRVTIVKRTKIELKELTFNFSQKKAFLLPMRMWRK